MDNGIIQLNESNEKVVHMTMLFIITKHLIYGSVVMINLSNNKSELKVICIFILGKHVMYVLSIQLTKANSNHIKEILRTVTR